MERKKEMEEEEGEEERKTRSGDVSESFGQNGPFIEQTTNGKKKGKIKIEDNNKSQTFVSTDVNAVN